MGVEKRHGGFLRVHEEGSRHPQSRTRKDKEGNGVGQKEKEDRTGTDTG